MKKNKQHEFKCPDGAVTRFEVSDQTVKLERLLGMDMAQPEDCAAFIALDTSLGCLQAQHARLKSVEFSNDNMVMRNLSGRKATRWPSRARSASGRISFLMQNFTPAERPGHLPSSDRLHEMHLAWDLFGGALRLESRWQVSASTGVLSRSDCLRNTGKKDVVVYRCLAQMIFVPGHYEIYSQVSRWCSENQGCWQSLHHGAIVLACDGGRMCQGGTPYACLREAGTNRGLALHVRPRGDWMIRIAAHTADGDSLPMVRVEAGLADGDLRLKLKPGAELILPVILMQALPSGAPHLAAPALHRYLAGTDTVASKTCAPVIFNTWFDAFQHLDVSRLRKQLAAARAMECEVFMVDAGWYGTGSGDWWLQAGNWREKPDGAFFGKMREFSDEVRAAGLGFGLWMEPERVGADAPILKEHPEWFLPASYNCQYPNLAEARVYKYTLAEISRLIETYGVAWLKIDFNFKLGNDPSNTQFAAYYEAWYRMLDSLRAKYPDTFFEGCASGGMRLDMETLSHFNGHLLSDTMAPIDVLRIYQGALLRLPPGKILKLMTLRAIGRTIPDYKIAPASSHDSLVAPGGATWENAAVVDLDFIARICLPGIFGICGDIAGLPAEAIDRARHHVRFFKQWRKFIYGSFAHLLTPPGDRDDRTGWAAIQLQHPGEKASLVFVYRLDDGNNRRRFNLRGLAPDGKYQVVNDDAPGDKGECFTGKQLMNDGLWAELSARNRAAVFVITPR